MAKRATLAVLVAGLLAGPGISAWAQTSRNGNVTTPGAAPSGSDAKQHVTSDVKARSLRMRATAISKDHPIVKAGIAAGKNRQVN